MVNKIDLILEVSMVRGKKIFTIGSIISIALTSLSLMMGLIEDAYEYHYTWYDYYYYETSFDYCYSDYYWILFGLVMTYVALNIVAIVLYNKRIKAINIINLVLTCIVHVLGFNAALMAIDC